MTTNFERVCEFHIAFGVPVIPIPMIVPEERRVLRRRLMREELEELLAAMILGSLVDIADGLADLLYVVYGTAAEYGIPIDKVFAEVHHSNMTKLDENSDPIYREDGKVLKGPLFQLPRIKEIIEEAQNV